MSEPKTLIVGAGLAGLCCAKHFSEAGIECQILEASDRIGGRVQTDQVDGFLLDHGFQVLLTAYPEAQSVLDYNALNLQPFDPGALIQKNNRWYRFADPLRQPQHALSTLFSPLATIGDKLRILKLKNQLLGRSLEEIYDRPETTTLQAIRNRGFSPTIIESFFRPFLSGVFLEDKLETSSRMFEFVFKMFSAGNVALPEKGMGEIPRQLASALPSDSIRLNTPVSHVQTGIVTLADGQQLEADHIVLATPAPTTKYLLGNRGGKPAEDQSWNGVTCLYFAAAKTSFANRTLILNGSGQGPISNMCIPSSVASSYAPQGQSLISVSVLNADALYGDNLTEAVKSQLSQWFGAELKDCRHLKTYSVPYSLPRQNPPHLSPVQKDARIQDGLYQCGDFLDTGSIQGAFMSAGRVAKLILNR